MHSVRVKVAGGLIQPYGTVGHIRLLILVAHLCAANLYLRSKTRWLYHDCNEWRVLWNWAHMMKLCKAVLQGTALGGIYHSFSLSSWSYVKPKQLVADPNCYTGLKLSDVWAKVANKHLQSSYPQPKSKGTDKQTKCCVQSRLYTANKYHAISF